MLQRALIDNTIQALRFLKSVRVYLFVGIFSAAIGGLIVAFVSYQFQMSLHQTQINTIMLNSLKKSEKACDRFLARLEKPVISEPVLYAYEFANLSALFHTLAFQPVYIDYLDQLIEALDSLRRLESEYYGQMKNVDAIKSEAATHCSTIDVTMERYF